MKRMRVDLLLGRVVYGHDARKLGRIRALTAERIGGEWVIKACVLGSSGLLTRVSTSAAAMLLGQRFGGRLFERDNQVLWKQLDLADLHHLRITHDAAEKRSDR